MTAPNLDRKHAGDGTPAPEALAKPAIPDFDLMTAVRSGACVLLTGGDAAVREVAYQIHRLSDWNRGPFVILDGGWPEDVIEHALAGVFTAPVNDSPDAPERAGTVLLHQVGRLDRAVQSRLADRLLLLRGQGQPRWSRWRLIVSTSEALLRRISEGTFDDRLYYRLNVIHLVIPAERAARPAVGIHGVDEGLLLTRGLVHDARGPWPPARRGGPRLGLRTW